VKKIGCELETQAGLASAAGTSQRDEAYVYTAHQPAQVEEEGFSTYEGGGLRGKIVGAARETPEGREIRRQRRDQELV
jgi:hypothetical protein